VDRIGYRVCIVAAHVLCAGGLVGLAVLPMLLSPYAGLMAAVVLYAIGGGLLEVLVSPIVQACPADSKSAAMSLLHSFYCWGTVGVVVLSTVLFRVLGMERWWMVACF
jgi:fucose permease